MSWSTYANKWSPKLVVALQLVTWSTVGIVLLQRGAVSLRGTQEDNKGSGAVQPEVQDSIRDSILDAAERATNFSIGDADNSLIRNYPQSLSSLSRRRKDGERTSGDNETDLEGMNVENPLGYVDQNELSTIKKVSTWAVKNLREAREKAVDALPSKIVESPSTRSNDSRKGSLDSRINSDLVSPETNVSKLDEGFQNNGQNDLRENFRNNGQSEADEDFRSNGQNEAAENFRNNGQGKAAESFENNGQNKLDLIPMVQVAEVAKSIHEKKSRLNPINRAGAAAAMVMLAIGIVMLLLGPIIVILRAFDTRRQRREGRFLKSCSRRDLPPSYEQATLMDQAPRYSTLRLDAIIEISPPTEQP